jgi:hypothetical protein
MPEAVVCNSAWPPAACVSWHALHTERTGCVIEMVAPLSVMTVG